MKKLLTPGAAMLLAAVCVCLAEAGEPFDLEITIAPNTVALGSIGGIVSVHTNIAYGAVDLGSLVLYDPQQPLDKIPVWWTKADAQGNLVAKFNIGDVKELVKDYVGGSVELTFEGLTNSSDWIKDTDIIKVKK